MQQNVSGSNLRKEHYEMVGLNSSGLSYSYQLTIAPCDHMILLISLALLIIELK